jgi:hypothetical protein
MLKMFFTTTQQDAKEFFKEMFPDSLQRPSYISNTTTRGNNPSVVTISHPFQNSQHMIEQKKNLNYRPNQNCQMALKKKLIQRPHQ